MGVPAGDVTGSGCVPVDDVTESGCVYGLITVQGLDVCTGW